MAELHLGLWTVEPIHPATGGQANKSLSKQCPAPTTAGQGQVKGTHERPLYPHLEDTIYLGLSMQALWKTGQAALQPHQSNPLFLSRRETRVGVDIGTRGIHTSLSRRGLEISCFSKDMPPPPAYTMHPSVIIPLPRAGPFCPEHPSLPSPLHKVLLKCCLPQEVFPDPSPSFPGVIQ